ncbi:MAG TPA: hypothetical protein VN026_01135 [Bacteroidia bacterium]|jgi:hypothetical protein|nr:hypothetical protein [Bacteroidia bacterium]
MKKIIALLFVAISVNMFSQDKEIGRDTSNKIIPHPVWTPDPNDPLVAHYDYQKPEPKKNNIVSRTEADTTYNLKSAFKLQLTSLLADKFALSYERVFKHKLSWEFTPAYIFANPAYDGISQSIRPNIAFKSTGCEIRFGLNLLFVKPYREQSKKMHSKGLFISFRYQHADNVDYSNDGKGGQGYGYSYKVSQTKNLIGVFYRSRIFEGTKKAGIEGFYEFGFYTGMSRTVCFSYSGAYGDDKGEPMSVTNVGIPFENGFVFMPVVRIGMALRLNKWRKQ